jgi:hypothetical protein
MLHFLFLSTRTHTHTHFDNYDTRSTAYYLLVIVVLLVLSLDCQRTTILGCVDPISTLLKAIKIILQHHNNIINEMTRAPFAGAASGTSTTYLDG